MTQDHGRTGRRAGVLVAHPSAELYGSDRVLLETIEALCDDGLTVTVTLPAPGPLVEEIRSRGGVVELCPTPVLRKSALRPVGMLRLLAQVTRATPAGLRLIRRSGADVIFVNTITIPLWLVLARLLRRRVICHVHEAEGSAPLLLRRLLAAPLLLATRLIANSRFSRGVLASAFPSLGQKTSVIHNGVAGPEAPTPAREQIDGAARLLYVGRLSPRKGPSVAIEAVSMLLERGVDARLDVVGSVFPGYEWFAEELAELVRVLDLGERVTFHGFEPDVWPRIADADIMIVPSQVDEPFGNTAVEAVLAARPAVVSATTGLVEAAEGYRSVVRVEPSRPDALADAVGKILENWGEYRSAALADAHIARERHGTARYRQQVGRFTQDILARSSRFTAVPS